MAEEIEAKILNVDIPELEKKLVDLGAQRVGEKFFRSTVFDYPGFPLDKDNSWIRLRDEGDKIMLAFKKRLGVTDESGSDEGMEEIEFTVGEFDAVQQFLQKLGLIVKFAQEKKRITYQKDTVTYDIDTWPKLPPYLEVEGPTWESVDNAIVELGYNLEDKKIFTTTQIYEMNGIHDKDFIKLTFSEFVKR